MESSSQSGLANVLACLLSFLAAAISSAAGVGGGSLYAAILTVVAGTGAETAPVLSRFMVTGASLSNVLYTSFLRGAGPGGEPLIDYDVAVASLPCLLLCGSAGPLCAAASPEWLITALFAAYLGFTTFKTCRAGVRRWRTETVSTRRIAEDGGDVDGMKEALLGRRPGGNRRCHWVDMAVLVLIWVCIFLVHSLVGGKVAKAISTRSMLHVLPADVFPAAALLTGVLSGLFGIGEGLLLNPIFIHIGVPPKTASATTMFMVLFSSSMLTVQSMILGVSGIVNALVYAIVCFVASIVGVAFMERAIRKSGRVSLVVLAVATVMALSAAVILCSRVARVWAQCAAGEYMGFKKPC